MSARRRRLGVRLALLLFASVALADVLMAPFYGAVLNAVYSEWNDPETVRVYLHYLETGQKPDGFVPLDEIGGKDGLVLLGLATANGLVVAGLCWLGVTRVVTRRIERLAAASATPADVVPGPFEDDGHDEVGALAEALNGMRARVATLVGELERRDASRREWIAQTAHDLRTPLTALVACLERMERALPPGDDELRATLDAARHDARRVSELTEDLFEIARLDADEPLASDEVPPGQLVREAVTGLTPLAKGRGIALSAVIGNELPVLVADGRRLARALENLLRNALEHAASRVEVVAEAGGDSVSFLVVDDGPGFERVDARGIGLTVTERVASAHGGALDVENASEGGARVRLRVPTGD